MSDYCKLYELPLIDSLENELVEYISNKSPDILISLRLLNVIKKTYDAKIFCIITRSETGINGVLLFYYFNSKILTKTIFTPRNGVYSEDQILFESMYATLESFSKNKRVEKISINSSIYCVGFDDVKKKTYLGIDLAVGKEELWKQLRSKTRNSIRKGEKYNIVIKRGHENLGLFYSLYNSRMRQKNVPIVKYSYFENLIKVFAEDCQIYVAFYKDKPIATTIFLYSDQYAFYSYSSIMTGYEKIRPIYYVLWTAIEDCFARKIKFLNLGESRKGSGTYEFKTLFGGKEFDTFYLENHLSSPNLLKKVYSRLCMLRNKSVNCICRLPLPDSIKERIILYKNRYERVI